MIEFNPVMQRNMSAETVLALDDNSMTFQLNPGNGVLIPAYEPAPTVEAMRRDDHALLQLKYWLLQPSVMRAKDVRQLDKTRIFTTSLESYKQTEYGGYSFTA
jgi:hypothetical protein